eukprot:3122010-Pyramimonas_sp.AAC.1
MSAPCLVCSHHAHMARGAMGNTGPRRTFWHVVVSVARFRPPPRRLRVFYKMNPKTRRGTRSRVDQVTLSMFLKGACMLRRQRQNMCCHSHN